VKSGVINNKNSEAIKVGTCIVNILCQF
jgi:hypothetical protein